MVNNLIYLFSEKHIKTSKLCFTNDKKMYEASASYMRKYVHIPATTVL
jgi:hypothetical protein